MIAERRCEQCDKPFEQIKVRNIGRDQVYCSAACRQAAYRARDRGTKRHDQRELRDSLMRVWQRQGFQGEALAKLLMLFDRYGVLVASEAAEVARLFCHANTP